MVSGSPAPHSKHWAQRSQRATLCQWSSTRRDSKAANFRLKLMAQSRNLIQLSCSLNLCGLDLPGAYVLGMAARPGQQNL